MGFVGQRDDPFDLFAALVGVAAAMLLGRSERSFCECFFVVFDDCVHGFLDAMTTAVWELRSSRRSIRRDTFFPWKPILVSPIGLGRFLSQRGAAVLGSESFTSGCRPLLSARALWTAKTTEGRTGKRGAQLKTLSDSSVQRGARQCILEN